MNEKLRDYQVLDVMSGGTFYKVRHKVTNNIFAWKAVDCSVYSSEQIQKIINEVKTISEATSENILRYYNTILHAPSKTLYFVLEYISWRSIDTLISICRDHNKYVAESFAWYLLYELARVVKAVDGYRFVALRQCISTSSVFVEDNGALRVNCFDLCPTPRPHVMQQVGDVVHALCYSVGRGDKIQEFRYSEDLQDVIRFLTDDSNAHIRPDVVLYHPTVLANLELTVGSKLLSEVLISNASPSKNNKCDSEKAVELCRFVEPALRSELKLFDSPLYVNINSKELNSVSDQVERSPRASLSPTIAALALELPGFVPRTRRPLPDSLASRNSPQLISEQTLSQQWMSRLISLRQREQSLNNRERYLISKEIMNSPGVKVIPFSDAQGVRDNVDTNGITLPPPVVTATRDGEWISRRHRRTNSVRIRRRRKSYAYEDLDSSLSADPGDSSVVVTATKFTKDNIPRRNIFPEVSTKKVHFTSSNPFVESDESVTLTFYELENVDGDGYRASQQINEGKVRDITKFKYLDLEKVTSEKRATMQQSHPSPSKQAKTTKNIFADITNRDMKKIPSRMSLASKCREGSSESTRIMSSTNTKVSEGNISERTRSSARLSLAPPPPLPALAQPQLKKPKSRKSLLYFKAPFKFMAPTKI